MDKLNMDILKELNSSYGREWLTFSEKGLALHYKGALKGFIEENNIVSKVDFDKRFGDFRDEVLIKNGLDELLYCGDNDMLHSYNFGLTNAPVFGIGGVLGVEDMPVKYAFLFFNRYQVVDWLEELVKSGEVTFETFVDNTKAYEASLAE
ncbi:hypothetical protein C6B36_06870 [Helicobacter cinaedi]|uniref:hypothetical protein n=1 Tax=Helicobacter cinaedi TaxID=213 RepID=UPI000CF10FA4|nr:hypothetical protein [Helicobacter cinaedi]AWK62089.1 hypothetical protein C6B36_06870 [Helicobacter cinaedi]QOQ95355.1 hypothetical protein HW245_06640 [Helicobacter cinaedi]